MLEINENTFPVEPKVILSLKPQLMPLAERFEYDVNGRRIHYLRNILSSPKVDMIKYNLQDVHTVIPGQYQPHSFGGLADLRYTFNMNLISFCFGISYIVNKEYQAVEGIKAEYPLPSGPVVNELIEIADRFHQEIDLLADDVMMSDYQIMLKEAESDENIIGVIRPILTTARLVQINVDEFFKGDIVENINRLSIMTIVGNDVPTLLEIGRRLHR